MKLNTLSIIVAGLLISASGCSGFPTGKAAFMKTKKMLTPSSWENNTTADSSDEEWSFVGEEGRKGQAREKDPDPWFRNNLMSDKARSIEKNLGID